MYKHLCLALNKMGSNNVEELEENLVYRMDDIAEDYKIILKRNRSYQKFEELIRGLYKKHGKVVVLIDEYDKPILDNVLDLENVTQIRNLLKKFYGVIKGSEEYLRFSFITGVSKFTQVSIFSDLNNLDDITMDVNYASICGFTQHECEHYFAPWIDENAIKHKMSKVDYLEKLRVLYDGIRFSEEEVNLYNPVSFTNAMDHGNFKHYWFETGTPTFLLKLLKQIDYDIINFEKLELRSDAFSSYEIDKLRVEPLLYQTGYLTIKDYDPDSYIYMLSYPNREVKEAFVAA